MSGGRVQAVEEAREKFAAGSIAVDELELQLHVEAEAILAAEGNEMYGAAAYVRAYSEAMRRHAAAESVR